MAQAVLDAPKEKTTSPSTALPRLYAGVAIVLLWEVVVRGWAPSYVATPLGIVAALPRVIVDPAFLSAAWSTIGGVAEGLVISIVLGTLLGLVMGRSVIADRALQAYVNGCYTIPMVVVLPLVSLWFGYTGATRLATIVFAALFSVTVNVADGARSVPREYVEVARSFRSGSWRALFEIVLPASAPYFFAGVRLAAGRALIGAVVAEFFTAIPGLGYFILYNSRVFRHDDAFVAVLLLGAFGVGFDALVNYATRRYLPWYHRDEAPG
jgi:ABC-type nitrate/sulfonate/bicarbonate transport system permease component